VICVLDALDECRGYDRHKLLRFLSDFYGKSSSQGSSLKFLVTSRPYDDIESGFHEWIPTNLPTIRLSGEKENDKIHKEIDLVIQERVAKLASKNRLFRIKMRSLNNGYLEWNTEHISGSILPSIVLRKNTKTVCSLIRYR